MAMLFVLASAALTPCFLPVTVQITDIGIRRCRVGDVVADGRPEVAATEFLRIAILVLLEEVGQCRAQYGPRGIPLRVACSVRSERL